MARSETAVITLEETKERFEEWRSSRRGKARIPAELSTNGVALEVWRRGRNRRLYLADIQLSSAHPERFVSRPPQPLPAPREVWINKPQPSENKSQ